MSPEYAQRQMAKWAAVICDGLNGAAALSALATFFPFVDYKLPTRFSAAYFPAWVINAEVEVDATVRGSERTSTVIFKNSYIPGSHVPTLSAAPLWSRSFDNSEPTPFDESLLKQHGQEIQCIPFTTSPFSLWNVADSLPDGSVNISEKLSFAPSSLQTNLFSAYPVLIPLYVAQYEPEDPESSNQALTLFIQAHGNEGCIMTARTTNTTELLDEVLRQIKFGTMELEQNEEVLLLGEADSRVQLEAVDLKPFRGADKLITQWLETPLRSYSHIEALASMGKLENDDDPRIREMTEEARDELDKIFKLTKEIVMLERVVETISHRKPGEVIISLTKGEHGFPKIGNASTSALQDRLLELKEKLHNLKPHWWIQWELSEQGGNLAGKK
ncbi:hypothetical protein M413DRAFT_446786 [Hebeloma cylindrosporum]|uniref:Uncharacterized protein n=1 Tax=Hebeloma cylindrosporum TaxID=76867 RepID=A0A0C2YFM8_HEBCY|nr:hypothetical protein M413DRAFT_446786 [Hebeloma cylindrosporum h7]